MGLDDVYQVRTSLLDVHHPDPLHAPVSWVWMMYTKYGRLYWMYVIQTHDMHKWLFKQLKVLLMMGTEGVQNM